MKKRIKNLLLSLPVLTGGIMFLSSSCNNETVEEKQVDFNKINEKITIKYLGDKSKILASQAKKEEVKIEGFNAAEFKIINKTIKVFDDLKKIQVNYQIEEIKTGKLSQNFIKEITDFKKVISFDTINDSISVSYQGDKTKILASQAEESKILIQGFDSKEVEIVNKAIKAFDDLRKLHVSYQIKETVTGNLSQVFTKEITDFKKVIDYDKTNDSIVINYDGEKTLILASQAQLDKVLFTGFNSTDVEIVNKQIQAFDDLRKIQISYQIKEIVTGNLSQVFTKEITDFKKVINFDQINSSITIEYSEDKTKILASQAELTKVIFKGFNDFEVEIVNKQIQAFDDLRKIHISFQIKEILTGNLSQVFTKEITDFKKVIDFDAINSSILVSYTEDRAKILASEAHIKKISITGFNSADVEIVNKQIQAFDDLRKLEISYQIKEIVTGNLSQVFTKEILDFKKVIKFDEINNSININYDGDKTKILASQAEETKISIKGFDATDVEIVNKHLEAFDDLKKLKVSYQIKEIVTGNLSQVYSKEILDFKKNGQLWNNDRYVNYIKEHNMNNLSYEDEFKNAKFIAPFNKSIKPSNVMYQLTVYSFADGNDDGIGDFIGLNENLDYFSNLGIDTLYLSPIHPASSYHGYDVIDYTDVAPELGGMKAFDQFLINAHKKGIKVILDWVINHTSYEHPWFQAALKGQSDFNGFYNFYNDPYAGESKYGIDDANTKKGFYNIDKNLAPTNKRYVAEFWGGMPDLNMKNDKTRKEIINAMKFWVKKGIDGFRFDAFYHIFGSENWHEFKDNTGGETAWLLNEQRLALRKIIQENAAERSSSDIFFFGEWWGNPRDAQKYFVAHDSARPYEEKIAIDTVIDGNHFKNGFLIEGTKEMADGIYNDQTNFGNLRTWLPFLDNHDVHRWINSHYYKNPGMFHVTTPYEDIEKNDYKALNAMAYGLTSLLIQSGTPILYNGNELNMRGGPKDKSDASVREAFKWNNNKYQVDFYERRSGINSSHIFLNLSKNENSVEEAQSDQNSNYNLTRKLIEYRKNNPNMFIQNSNTYANIDDIFKDNFRNYGNDTKYYLKAKKAGNKILVLANTIKNHTNNSDNWKLKFKNTPTNINIIAANNSKIENDSIIFNGDTGLMLVELSF